MKIGSRLQKRIPFTVFNGPIWCEDVMTKSKMAFTHIVFRVHKNQVQEPATKKLRFSLLKFDSKTQCFFVVKLL